MQGRIPNLGCALVGKDNADRFENKCGREVMEDYWPVFLSAVFARYKLLWYELGVLAVKKKGDLRTAFLVEDPTKILTAMLRWKYGRERIHHPEIQTAMLWVRRQRNCRQLLDRIRKALGSAPRDVSELTLKYFLIEHWPTALRARGDSFVPPLAYMSDMGLDGFLVYAEVGADYLMDAKEKASRTRKIWEHLGLKRSRFAGLDAVSGGGAPGIRQDMGRKLKRRCPRRFPSLPPTHFPDVNGPLSPSVLPNTSAPRTRRLIGLHTWSCLRKKVSNTVFMFVLCWKNSARCGQKDATKICKQAT